MGRMLTGVVVMGASVAAGAALMTALDRRARRSSEDALQADIARFENESTAPPPAAF